METRKSRDHSSSNTMYDLSKLTSDEVLDLLDSISVDTNIEDDEFEDDFDDDDSIDDPDFVLPQDQLNDEMIDLSLFGISNADIPSKPISPELISSIQEPSTSTATYSEFEPPLVATTSCNPQEMTTSMPPPTFYRRKKRPRSPLPDFEEGADIPQPNAGGFTGDELQLTSKDSWVLGWWMCKTVPYIQGVSVAASVYSLIAVSVDRFLAIWWPLKCQISKRRARIMILLIWFIALTTTIPWAVFFDLVVIFSDAPDVQLCIEVWPEPMNGALYFLIANMICCYILPMILITICYVLIWIKVWRRHIPTDTMDAQMERMQQKSKVKVVKMLVAVVILFVVSWLPLYLIFARIKLGGNIDTWEEEFLQTVTPIAQWLGASNSCINPILYAFFNKKYRRGFVAIIKSRRCCGRLRYYETVAMMSSSTSMRKSSHFYNNNSSTRRLAPVQEQSHAQVVSYISNNTGV